MAHLHSIYDCDTHFVIDPVTREIKNESGKTVIIQNDHNSERFSFELPKEIEGHDMSLCNVVQVHYVNTDSKTKEAHEGLYAVDDLQISPNSDDVVICSWLLSQEASKAIGTLYFGIVFKCVNDDGTLGYAWHTAINKDFKVNESLDNSDAVVEEYPDILAQLEARLAAVEQNGGSGGSVDVDLTDYVKRDEMPEINVDDVVERTGSTENSYNPESYPLSFWTDSSRLDNNGNIVSDEECCITPHIEVLNDYEYQITTNGEMYLYDLSMNFIERIYLTGNVLKTPENCFFIRFNVYKIENLEMTVESFNSYFGFYSLDHYKFKNNVQLPDNVEIPEDIVTNDRFTTQAENEEPIYGEELASADGWTADGWIGDFANGFTHTTENTNSLIFTMPEDTAQNTYRISFNCSETISVETLMVKCGNSDLFDLYGQKANPIVLGITAVENGNIEFVPASTFKGTITDISIKRVTGFNPTEQTITDSTGEISCEMRTTKSSLDNIFIGKHSGENNISGRGCSAVGSSALQNNTSGFWNVGIGLNALRDNTVGSRNVGIGYIALAENITGTRNIAIGTFALNHNKTGNKNIAIGADALDKNVDGSFNVGVGLQALYQNVSGNYNTAIGAQTLTTTTGSNNTAVGYNSLGYCTTGSGNVGIGYCAGKAITTGSNNFALGANSLYKLKTGSYNIAIGIQAGRGQGVTTGFKNSVFIGSETGYSLCDNADYNILIGYKAGRAITTGGNNICIGENAETPTPTTAYWVNIGGLYEGSRKPTDKYAKINGGLQLSDIPTTDPVIAGRVWNDNGTLKVSAG